MSTVSTLCATSTVAVAALGYCFGTNDNTSINSTSTTKKRKILHLQDHNYSNQSSEPHDNEFDQRGPNKRATPSPHSSPPSSSASNGNAATYLRSRTSPSSRAFVASFQPQNKLTRRRPRQSVAPPTADHLQYEVHCVGATRQTDTDSRGSLSSRRSWLQRLSSYSPSLTSSPGQQTPSISLSNGSSAPILASNAAQAHLSAPPNKLVKRSASQTIARHRSSSGLFDKSLPRPTLRRPATSHQRSATLQQLYSMDEGQIPQPQKSEILVETSMPNVNGINQPKSHQYFKSKRITIRKSSAFSVPTAHDRSERGTIRTVVPSSGCSPSLMKPISIDLLTDKDIADDYYDIAEEPFAFKITAQTPSTPVKGLDSPANTHTRSDQRKLPRHSFSIGDMFSSASPTWTSKSASNSASKPQGYDFGKRRSSVPINSIQRPATATAQKDDQSRDQSSKPSPLGRTNLVHQQESSPLSRKGLKVTSSPRSSPSSQLPPIDRFSGLHMDLTSPADMEAQNTDGDSIQSTHQKPDSVSSSRAVSPGGAPPSFSLSYPQRPQSHQRSFVASSERASTLVGSDGEARGFVSGEDDEMSETVFDSLRTGATNSSLGTRGPRIDTIFDESPRSDQERATTNTTDEMILDSASNSDLRLRSPHAQSEEDDDMSTPGKNFRESDQHGTRLSKPFQPAEKSGSDKLVASHKLLQESFDRMDLGSTNNTEDERWDFGDEDEDENWGPEAEVPWANSNHLSDPGSKTLSQLRSQEDGSHGVNDNEHSKSSRIETKGSLFDWSEPSDRTTPATLRPKTVHGKRAIGGRGGRTDGRRGPSSIHIRSQSVPVIPDQDGGRDSQLHNKHGTWGLGSKGISEYWDNDFVFDVNETPSKEAQDTPAQVEDSDSEMIVPQSIKESQANVIGNLGYIREFALLVEDLKRMRTLAADKGILEGEHQKVWKEAEAMIDLATVDNDEVEPLTLAADTNVPHTDVHEEDWNLSSLPTRGRRKSVLALEDDIFGGALEPGTTLDSVETTEQSSIAADTHKEQRTDDADTTLIAKTVIENMQHRRKSSKGSPIVVGSRPSDKVSFDTTTLKDLVAHVNTLARSLADILRAADGLPLAQYNPSSPSLADIFNT